MNKATEIFGKEFEYGFDEDRGNLAEAIYLSCDHCQFAQTENRNLPLKCDDKLRVSFGVASCNSSGIIRKDQKTGVLINGEDVRPAARFEILNTPGRRSGITYRHITDEEGLTFERQFKVTPNRRQKLLAKLGIDRVLWDPKDIS